MYITTHIQQLMTLTQEPPVALITCPECKKKISDTADSCPNCGYKLTPEKVAEIKKKQLQVQKGCGIGCLAVIVIFAILYMIGSFSSDSQKTKTSTPVVSYAGEVTSLSVRGKKIKIGDTADQIFSVLKQDDMVNQTISKDPNNPNSLLVIKNFEVEGKTFTIHFIRVEDPGPYKVVKIVAD